MIVNFIFLIFIFYLVFIYNQLQNNKHFNLENYIRNASLVIEKLEKDNNILKEQNNVFENDVIKNKAEIQKLDENINSKNNEINNLNKNYSDEKVLNKNFTSIFDQTEKNLYQQISDLKYNSKKNGDEFIELQKENASLKSQQKILYKYLKVADYALYEEFLRNI